MPDSALLNTNFDAANTRHALSSQTEILDDKEVESLFINALGPTRRYAGADLEKRLALISEAKRASANFYRAANTDGKYGIDDKEYETAKAALDIYLKPAGAVSQPLSGAFDTAARFLLKNTLIPWDTNEGVASFARSKYKVDFYPVVGHSRFQSNKLTCGPTTFSIIANALFLEDGKDLPVDKTSITPEERQYLDQAGVDPYLKKYTENNAYIEGTKTKGEVMGKPAIINGKVQPDYGFQLRQLATLFSAHDLDVKTRVVDGSISNEAIKEEIKKNLETSGDFVVVNYSRKALGQNGGGHISPVIAYDEKNDTFLIWDVNESVARPVWAPADVLINAMKTHDTVENRGYLLVSKKAPIQ